MTMPRWTDPGYAPSAGIPIFQLCMYCFEPARRQWLDQKSNDQRDLISQLGRTRNQRADWAVRAWLGKILSAGEEAECRTEQGGVPPVAHAHQRSMKKASRRLLGMYRNVECQIMIKLGGDNEGVSQ
jgi:hypothetical protein